MSQKSAKSLRRQLRKLRALEESGVNMTPYKQVFNGIRLDRFSMGEKVRATRVILRDVR